MLPLPTAEWILAVETLQASGVEYNPHLWKLGVIGYNLLPREFEAFDDRLLSLTVYSRGAQVICLALTMLRGHSMRGSGAGALCESSTFYKQIDDPTYRGCLMEVNEIVSTKETS